jgi:hypothetical protein
MSAEPVRQREVALGVQGCLIGSVALFVALLIGLLVIGYLQFIAPPADPPPPGPTGRTAPAMQPVTETGLLAVDGRRTSASRSLHPIS